MKIKTMTKFPQLKISSYQAKNWKDLQVILFLKDINKIESDQWQQLNNLIRVLMNKIQIIN